MANQTEKNIKNIQPRLYSEFSTLASASSVSSVSSSSDCPCKYNNASLPIEKMHCDFCTCEKCVCDVCRPIRHGLPAIWLGAGKCMDCDQCRWIVYHVKNTERTGIDGIVYTVHTMDYEVKLSEKEEQEQAIKSSKHVVMSEIEIDYMLNIKNRIDRLSLEIRD